MTATAAPDRPFAPVADSQAIFRVVLDAMARPGTIGLLPATDPRCPLPEGRALAALAQTLLDHEVTFAATPDLGGVAGPFARYLATTTGSRPTDIGEADWVVARAPLARGVLTTMKRGSLAFPDEGASLLLLVADLTAADGPTIELRGPGIAGALSRTLSGLGAAELAERRAANAESPRGIDLLLIDGGGHILCLPRTTHVGMEN